MEYLENVLGYEDYCRLRESVEWRNFSREQTERALGNSVCAVTAVLNGRAVGMSRLVGDGMYFVIVDVVVEPAYQRQGIGREMIRRLVEFVERETPVGGRSSVQLIAVKGKEEFYEKLGFRGIPNEDCGAGMRMVVYK